MATSLAIEKWHKFASDFLGAQVSESTAYENALKDLIADDAYFVSPVVHTPQLGKEITIKYLCAAAQVFSGNNFRYLNQWIGENSAVLEFEAIIEGVTINGIDMIFWNDENKISSFKVMVRPLKAINMLMAHMAGKLQNAI